MTGVKWQIVAEHVKTLPCARFGSTYTKIGTIQRRLAWPLRNDDTQIREVFYIFEDLNFLKVNKNVGKKKKRPCLLGPLFLGVHFP